MVRDDAEKIVALRQRLTEVVGPRRAAVWFGPQLKLALSELGLEIAAPNPFHLEFLRRTLRGEIESACRLALGNVPSLVWTLADGQNAPPNPPATDGSQQGGSATESSPAGETVVMGSTHTQTVAILGRPHGAHALQVTESGAAVAERPSRQPGLAAQLGEADPPQALRPTLDDFLPGQANRLALSTALTAARRPGTYPLVMLHGPSGVGKTHLLEAICGQFRQAHPRGRAVMMTAEQFTTLFLGALRGSGLPSFRHKVRGVELLAIDDVQFFLGKRATLEELLHTLKTLAQHRRQLVLAADRPLDELGEMGSELIERLRGGMICRVDAPDRQARLEIIARWAARLQLELPAGVGEQLADHCRDNVRQIHGALHRLHALTQALGQPVDGPLVTRALGPLAAAAARPLGLVEVERAVRDTLGLADGELRSTGRARQLTQVRTLAMFLARKHTRAALSEIGRYFGVRSHSSVITAERKVGSWLEQSAQWEVDQRQLSVSEVIARVESRLRTVG